MFNFQNSISCELAGICGGCPWIQKDLQAQREEKLKKLEGFFPVAQIKVHSVGDQLLRDRVDLTLKRLKDGTMGVGLWTLEGPRELVDLRTCPMMSPELESWFQEFRSRLPEVEMGSVRLRVSPSGERGVWLDFSNEDVKRLFEEKEYLKWLSSKAVVEIGQKRKPLYFEEDRPRLHKELSLKPWFQTWDLKGRSYPIQSAIGSFSQSGFKANRVLSEVVLTLCQEAEAQTSPAFWLEAFCGSGNFTYPLSQTVKEVRAFDNDSVSLKALDAGLKDLDIHNVKLRRVDLKSPRQVTGLVQDISSQSAYGMLADPPRSGLMKLLDVMEEGLLQPQSLVYISCFSDSLLKDGARLRSLGYELDALHLVDQFPHSPHVEWIGKWSRQEP